MTATIQETIATLHQTLQGYIEATYHIADPRRCRAAPRPARRGGRHLPDALSESTPRYQTGDTFADDDRHSGGRTRRLSAARASGDGQAAPVRSALQPSGRVDPDDPARPEKPDGHDRDGSGKTECFLLPILGKLAVEARDRTRNSPRTRARARDGALSDERARQRPARPPAAAVRRSARRRDVPVLVGRPARFARYTSRTPYAGRARQGQGSDAPQVDRRLLRQDRGARAPRGRQPPSQARMRAHELVQ